MTIRIYNSFDDAVASTSPSTTDYSWGIYSDNRSDAGCCGRTSCTSCILSHGSCVSGIIHYCQTYADPSKLYVELTPATHPEAFL